ncbi:hypothetical protein BX600DRAFT_505430 [Xylariales sp. PMI_506]|nr:hypothetical protein BX600DRAFT_505430 [Xylariales sp. PMI_506]
MATEATGDRKPVDVSLTDASHNVFTDPHSQHVDASVDRVGPLDEIENKQIAELVDELVNSAEVSVSGGSDTEASTARNGKSAASLDDKGHVRSSSTAVKKPQSFKSVSVNKTFLGAKNAGGSLSRPESAASNPSPVLPASSAVSSASKLKLVAKSGSSLGGSTKTLTTNGKGLSAPDPNTVWNKNRPVPQPEPKKLSDEELMSKYGIHMADRLRPEDDRGQSNWADIDDDDEWATDTITWTDGTKITLPQVDENHQNMSATPIAIPISSVPVLPSIHSEIPAYVPAARETSQVEKPKSPAPAGVASGSAKASPVIKPGVLASGKGLVLKGAPEKPTLVAKAPAPPTPVKSPWATLPPVDKAPPMATDIPSHNQPMAPSSFRRDGPPISKSITPPPTKEIAADDFSRTPWRDGSRELFNSQSGRYEPVNDRRGSRQDMHSHRQPALLQRPPHHEQQGPAEPSAAFQTSRTSAQDSMPYGRRRNSSNVSGGSGSFLNRLGKPHDMPTAQTDTTSQVSNSSYSPARPQPAQPWQPRPSPSQTHATPHQSQPAQQPAGAPDTPLEDDIELQKRLMRERREMAIKRRMEEEAREEAARKERIRLKLEAMGPAPERKSAKKEDSKDNTSSPQHRPDAPASLLPRDETAATAVEGTVSPSKDAPLSKLESPQINGATPHGYNNPSTSPARGGHPINAGSQSAAPWLDNHTQHQGNDRLASWSGGTQSNSRNVWGAPGNDRSLGNGTFVADLGHLADSQPAQPASISSRPTPIGPPRIAPQTQQPRTDQASNNSRLAPIGPPSSNRPGTNHQGQATTGRRPNLWATADIAADDRAIRLQNQKRIDDHVQDLVKQGLNADDPQVPVRDSWRGVNIGQDGKRTAGPVVTKMHGDSKDVQANPSWNATMGQPPREPVQSLRNMHSQDYRVQHHGPDGVRGEPGQPPVRSTGNAGASQLRAGSRFFPHSAPRDSRQDDGQFPVRSKSPTPPPPTMDGHPAYDGDVARPHVSLPPTRPNVNPRPIVKLPPAVARQSGAATPQLYTPVAAPKPSAPITFAAAAAANSRSAVSPVVTHPGNRSLGHGGVIMQKSHELTTQENWQEKINSLMGRRAGPPPSRPMTVDSSSKSAFDAHTNHPATVSLPGLSPTGSTFTVSSSVTSREMAEECFDEQEMGSLPLVHLPTTAPDALWPGKATDPNWHPLHARYRVDATAVDSMRFPYETVNNKNVYRIMAYGMVEAKTVAAPFAPRSKSNPKRQGGRSSRHVSRGGPRGGGSRENGDHSSVPPSERSERPERLSSNRGRGGYRTRSENWGRHSAGAAPQATQS